MNNTLSYLTARAAQLPANEDARISRLTATGGDRFGVIFNDNETQELIWTIPQIPASYQGNGTLYLDIHCAMENATSGTVGIDAYLEAGDVNIGSTSFDSVNTDGATVPGVAGDMFIVTIEIANADSMAVGNVVRIKLNRNLTSYNATGDLYVLGGLLYETVSRVSLGGPLTVKSSLIIESPTMDGTHPGVIIQYKRANDQICNLFNDDGNDTNLSGLNLVSTNSVIFNSTNGFVGPWIANSNYTSIYLNSLKANENDYNFVSSLEDSDLYINRPSGKQIRFREANEDQLILKAGGNLQTGPIYITGNAYVGSELHISRSDQGGNPEATNAVIVYNTNDCFKFTNSSYAPVSVSFLNVKPVDEASATLTAWRPADQFTNFFECKDSDSSLYFSISSVGDYSGRYSYAAGGFISQGYVSCSTIKPYSDGDNLSLKLNTVEQSLLVKDVDDESLLSVNGYGITQINPTIGSQAAFTIKGGINAVDIVRIECIDGSLYFQTNGPHNFIYGQTVTVSGLTNTDFNMTHIVTQIANYNYFGWSFAHADTNELDSGTAVGTTYSNLQEWMNSDGDILSQIDASGNIIATSFFTENNIRALGSILVGKQSLMGVSCINGFVPNDTSSNVPVVNIGCDTAHTGNVFQVTVDNFNLFGVDNNSGVSVVLPQPGSGNFIIRASEYQSVNLQEWQDNEETVLANVSSSGIISAPTFTSTVAAGTAPFTVTSDTAVNNLNADKLDGYDATDFVLSGDEDTNAVILTPDSSSRNIVQPSGAGYIPLTIKGYTSQSANLQEWQNSSGTILSHINSSGEIVGSVKLIARQSGGTVGTDEIQISHSGTSGLIENKDGDLVVCTSPGTTGTRITLVAAGGGVQIAGHSNINKYLFNAAEQRLSSDVTIGFCSSTTVTAAAADIGLSRSTAGILKITDGSTGYGSLICGPYSASTVGLTVKGYASQSAKLQEWQDSSATVKAAVTKDGFINVGGTTVGTHVLLKCSSSALFEVRHADDSNPANAFFGGGVFINTTGGGLQLSSAWQLHFCSGSNPTTTGPDSGISRSAAGILKITDGSSGLGSLTLGAYSASTVGLTVKGYTSQSANLQEWQNSSGTVLAKINSSGAMSCHATSSLDYTTTTAGSYLGFQSSAPTILLSDGTAANNIRLDNDTFGRFRIIKGASSLAQFGTSQIDLYYPVVGASNIQAKGNLQSYRTALQTANDLQQFASFYLDGFNGGGYGGTAPSSGFGIWGCARLTSDNGTAYLAHTQEYIAATAADASFKARVVNKVGDKDSGSGAYPHSAKEYLRAESDGTYGITSIGGAAVIASSTLSVTSPAATYVGLTVKGATSQSANLQEWQDSSGTTLTRITSDGRISLYNGSSTYFEALYFDGSNFSCRNGLTAGGSYYGNSSGSNSSSATIQAAGQNILRVYPNGIVTIASFATGSVPLAISGFSGQTGNLQEWKDSSGTVLAKVDKDGNINVGGSTTTAGALTIHAGANIAIFETTGSGGIRINTTSSSGNPYLQFDRTGTGWMYAQLTTSTNDLDFYNNGNINVFRIGQSGSAFYANAASTVGLMVKGASSQSANYFEVRDSANGLRFYMSPTSYSLGVGDMVVNGVSGGAITLPTSYTIQAAGSQRWTQVNPTVTTNTAAGIPLIVKGVASQSGRLTEWQNSSGTALAYIDSSGNLSAVTASLQASYFYDVGGLNRIAIGSTINGSSSGARFDVNHKIYFGNTYLVEDFNIALTKGNHGIFSITDYAAKKGSIACGSYGGSTPGFVVSGNSNTTKLITNVALTSNVATITTSGPHTFQTGQRVVISGLTNSGLNGTYTITNIPSTTTFKFDKVASNIVSVADSGYAAQTQTADLTQWKCGGSGAKFVSASSQSLSYSTTSLNADADMTISLWMNPIAGAGGDVFFVGTTNVFDGFRIAYDNTNNRININRVGTSNYAVSASSSIPPGVWTHVVVTYTASSGLTQVWINGTASGSTGNNTSSVGTKGYKLGYCGSNYYNGGLDAVGIWNKVLTSSDIASLFSLCKSYSDLNASETTLLHAWYDFASSGELLTDSSGNSRTLTNNGTVTADEGIPATQSFVNKNGVIKDRTRQTFVSASAACTFDCDVGNTQSIILAESTTLTVSNPRDGETYLWIIQQGGSGSYTVTWPGTFKWQSSAPTLSTTVGKVDIISFTYHSALNIYLASAAIGWTS
jgi:hypothetical protein